jgi:predicted DNA-binding transcriptional regulator AlpA
MSDVRSFVLKDYADLLSVDDLVKIFGVSKQTIYKELQAGKFGKPIRIGRAIKIPKIRLIQKLFISDG